jgi:hypothetical protein
MALLALGRVAGAGDAQGARSGPLERGLQLLDLVGREPLGEPEPEALRQLLGELAARSHRVWRTCGRAIQARLEHRPLEWAPA